MSEDPIGFYGQDANLYKYVGNDPINSTDSSGLILDSLLDLGFISYDLYRLIKESGCNLEENLAALGADLIGLAIPGATGLGSLTRLKGFTKHGLEQAAKRGISAKKVKNILSNPGSVATQKAKHGGTNLLYTKDGITVVVSNSGRNKGKVITVKVGEK